MVAGKQNVAPPFGANPLGAKIAGLKCKNCGRLAWRRQRGTLPLNQTNEIRSQEGVTSAEWLDLFCGSCDGDVCARTRDARSRCVPRGIGTGHFRRLASGKV